MTVADMGAYLESWADELNARANRVRNLIGDAHWVSDGTHKEALLRDFIQRHLPRHLVVSNGFIRSSSNLNNCSPEVDILIADSSAHAPLFAESDLYIAAPTGVAAHIEVKTSFAKGTLLAALQNIRASQALIVRHAQPERVWRAICFYTVPDSRTPESILDTLEECLQELALTERDVDCGSMHHALPICISAISDWVIFFSRDENHSVTLRFFQLGRLSAACAMADLFAALRRWSGGNVTGDLDRIIESISVAKPVVRTINLTAN